MIQANIRQIQLTSKQIDSIYLWIDKIPITRQKKNIARDFSDGLLLGEILSYYQPNLASQVQFPSINSVKGKVHNWQTINRIIFSKFGFQLSEEEIEQIVDMQELYIEKFLYFFKPYLTNTKYKCDLTNHYMQPKQVIKHNKHTKSARKTKHKKKFQLIQEKENSIKRVSNQSRNEKKVQINTNIIGSHFKANKINKNQNVETGGTDFENVLRYKDLQIQNLQKSLQIMKKKVSKLEELLKIKDDRIKELLSNQYKYLNISNFDFQFQSKSQKYLLCGIIKNEIKHKND